jgi:tetratricopeptide (TPR) repeat protein
MLDLTIDLVKVEKFIQAGDYGEAIERSLKILEKILIHLFEKVFTKLSLNLQLKIINEMNELFSGKKFDKLYIGSKLKIFNTYKLLSHLNIHVTKEVNINEFLKINDLRVQSIHDPNREMTAGEARYAQALILRFIELIGFESISDNIDSKEIKKKLSYSSKQDKLVLQNLPNKDYIQFIGRKKKIENIISLLLHENVHVLAIDGIGGVGKSALALEIAYTLKKDKIFDAIVWVSAKKDRLTYKGIVDFDIKFDTLEDLLNEILNVFDEGEFLKHGTLDSKKSKVLSILKENRCLLIVDNLETIDDENIKDFIIDVNFPIESKVLITSRKRLGQVERIVYLERFSQEETGSYIKSRLEEKGYKDLCSEELINDIHNKTGGIPLAIKLTIPWIIEGRIKDKLVLELDKETDILKFCFDRVYNSFLSDEAKKLFCIIAQAPTEINEAALRFISEIPDDHFNQSLSSLQNYSLIYIDKKEKEVDACFCMLPLTREFAKKTSNEDYPNLKNQINKSYLKYLEFIKDEEYSAKTAMAINKAEEAMRIYKNNGDVKCARHLFQQAINYDNKCDYVYYLASVFLKDIKEFSQAKNSIEKALNINDKNPLFWIEYAAIIENISGPKTAEKILEKAVEKTKNNRPLIHKLVLIRFKLQKYNKVIDLARKNILHKTKINKEKKMNTLFAGSIMEGRWRISSDFLKADKPELALKELTEGIYEIDSMLNENIIFGNDRGLDWQIKKAYRKMGDISVMLGDRESAGKFYQNSLYEMPFFDDNKRHNSIIMNKIKETSQD